MLSAVRGRVKARRHDWRPPRPQRYNVSSETGRSVMRRRDIFEMGAALAASQAAPVASAQTPRRGARMKLGTQHGESDEILRTMAAFGVNHIAAHTPSKQLDEKWSVDSLSRLRERIE